MTTARMERTIPLRFSLPVALAVITFVAFLSTPNGRGFSVELALASFTLLVGLTPVLRRLGPSLNVLEPIIPASLTLVVLFGLRPLVMVHDRDLTYFGMPVADGFREAVLLGLVGTAGFVVAYELSSRKPQIGPPTPPRMSVRASLIVASVATVLGLALFTIHLSRARSLWDSLVLLATGSSQELTIFVATSSEYLSSAPILGACGAVIIVAVAGNRRLGIVPALLVAFASLSTVGIFALAGARRFVLPALLIPVVVAYLARGRAPRVRTILLALPLTFLVLAIFPNARTAGARENEGGALSIYARGLARPDQTVSGFLRGHDTEMIAALAAEVEVLNTGADFDLGKATLGDLLLAPIPSAIFAGKPTTARDTMLIRIFGGRCVTKEGSNQCPDFSAIGTFYQDFWIAGVLVGMAVLGLGSAALWRLYLRDTGRPTVVAVTACWVVFLPILIRAGMMPAFAWVLYFALPSLVGLHLTAVLQRRCKSESGGGIERGAS